VRRLIRQLFNDLASALALARRRYRYLPKAGTVGSNTGVTRDRVRFARSQCDINFRYRSVGDLAVVNQIFQHQEYSVAEGGPHGRRSEGIAIPSWQPASSR
jgi:hypothetical protein